MHKILISFILLLSLLTSCSKSRPKINVDCERNGVGNYILRWETTPKLDGHVVIYGSSNPAEEGMGQIMAKARISDQIVTVINDDPLRRYYFTMVFDEKYEMKVSNRKIMLPGVKSFMDFGGYFSYMTQSYTKWGKLYHSSSIHLPSEESEYILRRIGIRTILDLRVDTDSVPLPEIKGLKRISVPLENEQLKALFKRLARGERDKSMIDTFKKQLLVVNNPVYSQIFKELLKAENYPMVIEASAGNVSSGFIISLVLTSLGISPEIITDDYIAQSKKNAEYQMGVDKRTEEQMAESSRQVMLSGTREVLLHAILQGIDDYYGDMQTYLYKGIGLSRKDISTLRSLLLDQEK